MTDICLHEKCIDCPLLPTCKKDTNEYDSEKAEKYKDSLHCPNCGFILLATTDGRGFCITCGVAH